MRLHVLVEHKLAAKLFLAKVAGERFLVARVAQFVRHEFVFEQKALRTHGAVELEFTWGEQKYIKYKRKRVDDDWFLVTQMFAAGMLAQGTVALEDQMALGTGDDLRIVGTLVRGQVIAMGEWLKSRAYIHW